MNPKENERNGRRSTFDVYVGHVPKNIHEDKIKELFLKYGEVSDVLCRCGSGTYGYAIVKFKHQKDADNVLKEVKKVSLNGHEMEVKNGKRSNQNTENGNDNSCNNSACFMEPSSIVMRGINNNDPILQPKEHKYAYHDSKNGLNAQTPVMMEVMCTNVENSVTFYGCPIYRCEELQNLSMKLNVICSQVPRLSRKPGLRKLYGALFGEDMAWYRCSVIQSTIALKPGVCIVEYVDYGNKEEVCYTNMVELPEPIKSIPPFAVKCILTNLMCNPKSHCDISYLHHLINQRMSLCALPSWELPEYQVLKCSCNGIDVISELIRNGFAVYRPEKSEKVSTSKGQENHKSKKGNSSRNNSKKNTAIKESTSHVEKQSHNGTVTITNHVNLKNFKNRSSPEVQPDLPRDFVPKIIIKRGSNINGTKTVPPLEEVKVKETVNNFLKVDCVISNLKLVNSVRNLVSLKSDDDVINNALTVLLSDMNVKSSEDSRNELEKAYEVYLNILNEIKSCSDQELLGDLKIKRKSQMTELCEKLNTYFESCDSSLFEKRKSIQTMITDLESNSNDWMNVFLSSQPVTVDDLVNEYKKEKEKRWDIIQKARKNTNEKHKKFSDFLSDLQKEFTLNTVEEESAFSYLDNSEGKKGSWALKFEEALTNLGHALDEEMKMCNVNKGKSCVSVIQCILNKLDIPKERIDAECELYEKYKSLERELLEMFNLESNFVKLKAVKITILYLTSKCANDDPEKVKEDNLYASLHDALLREDNLLISLAKASSLHFPELDMEHPEFNLAEFRKNSYLLKNGWKKEFFPFVESCARVEPSYISVLKDYPVVIKEFVFEDNMEKNSFIKKVIVWNGIKSKSLVKIKALFNEDEKPLCALIPSVWRSLFENPLSVPVEMKAACHILQQILLGLRDIHARGMAHGAVHPLAILHEDGEILLDFNYDMKFMKSNLCIKGVNFQVPNGEDMCKSADMYGYGCLVLWIFFPNLSFTSTATGVPNLSAFQSIIQELLSEKDFAALTALLATNPDLRPSSRDLLSSGFLKDLRVI